MKTYENNSLVDSNLNEIVDGLVLFEQPSQMLPTFVDTIESEPTSNEIIDATIAAVELVFVHSGCRVTASRVRRRRRQTRLFHAMLIQLGPPLRLTALQTHRLQVNIEYLERF